MLSNSLFVLPEVKVERTTSNQKAALKHEPLKPKTFFFFLPGNKYHIIYSE
jgi:hypothetical protein